MNIDFGTIDMMTTDFNGHFTFVISQSDEGSDRSKINNNLDWSLIGNEYDSPDEAEQAIIDAGLDFSDFQIYEVSL